VKTSRRSALLDDPDWSGMVRVGGVAQAAARARGAAFERLPITADPASVNAALDQLLRRRPDGAVLVTSGAIMLRADWVIE